MFRANEQLTARFICDAWDAEHEFWWNFDGFASGFDGSRDGYINSH